ncbi:hypothetical protein [Microbacterium maritypicum]
MAPLSWLRNVIEWISEAASTVSAPLLAVADFLGFTRPWNFVVAAGISFAAIQIVAFVWRRAFTRLSWVVEDQAKTLRPGEVDDLEPSPRIRNLFTLFRGLRALARSPLRLTRPIFGVLLFLLAWELVDGRHLTASFLGDADLPTPSIGDVASIATLLIVSAAFFSGGLIRARSAMRALRYQRAVHARFTTARAADVLGFTTNGCLHLLAQHRRLLLERALSDSGATGEALRIDHGRVRIEETPTLFRGIGRAVQPLQQWHDLFFESQSQLEALEREVAAAADAGGLGLLLRLSPASATRLIHDLRPVPAAVRISIPRGAAHRRPSDWLPRDLRAIDPAFLTWVHDENAQDSLADRLRRAESREQRQSLLQEEFEIVNGAAADAIWYSVLLTHYARTAESAVNGRWWERVIGRASDAQR